MIKQVIILFTVFLTLILCLICCSNEDFIIPSGQIFETNPIIINSSTDNVINQTNAVTAEAVVTEAITTETNTQNAVTNENITIENNSSNNMFTNSTFRNNSTH